jgi:hypothetical protein
VNNFSVRNWQTVSKCFVCGIDSNHERLIPVTLAVGPDDLEANVTHKYKSVCMPCGAHVKGIIEAFTKR